ncbi:GntR family transcriptional regulator [Microbacterium flavescens]|jgi:DNA-binding transcriptional regulator YhcF (GntR family)|uniref:GntR family transcriptional regulator n=1 Tax=Microbacterium flavescens TaxID=69366 RepID=UPI001BDF4350|nr:GntR family transcriptional regulator [Microbacterium flavescens]BFF11127.1 GntR family transcriptional regulator [Microbacterium flavescens]
MITIDPASPIAPFEQLRGGLLEAISSGELAAGQRLPTVRRLAEDLGVAPGTVARAYRELEASGVIETRGRNGTFVSFAGDPAHRAAQQAATAFAEQIRTLRIDPEEALALVAAALRGGGPGVA